MGFAIHSNILEHCKTLKLIIIIFCQLECLVTVPFNEESETGEAIKEVMFVELEQLGITREEAEKITFVSDNGSNVVAALSDFFRLYCVNHAINICLKNGLSVKYHDILEKSFNESAHPVAHRAVTACDNVVRFIKAVKGRLTPRYRKLKSALHQSKKQHSSNYKMLTSVQSNWKAVRTTLFRFLFVCFFVCFASLPKHSSSRGSYG